MELCCNSESLILPALKEGPIRPWLVPAQTQISVEKLMKGDMTEKRERRRQMSGVCNEAERLEMDEGGGGKWAGRRRRMSGKRLKTKGSEDEEKGQREKQKVIRG